MSRLFSSVRKRFYTLGAISVMLGSVFGVMPARAEAVATIGADMRDDARLVGSLIQQVGSDASGDLAALGNAFFDLVDYAAGAGRAVGKDAGSDLALLSDVFFTTFENIGSAAASGGKLMASDMGLFGTHAFDGVAAMGESLVIASDSFFNGAENMGSDLAMAGDVFFGGAEQMGKTLAVVGERVDGALLANANVSLPAAQLASGPRTRHTFPVAQSREAALAIPTPTPVALAAPAEPAPLPEKREPLSAVAGLKVVANNLILGQSDSDGAAAPANFDFYIGSARAHLANNNYTAAVANFEKALALEPESLATYQALAQAHAAQGNADKAIQAIERGLAKGGRMSTDYLLQVGRLYFKRHTADDLVIAERAFRESLALNPSSAEAIFALGAVAEAKDNLASR